MIQACAAGPAGVCTRMATSRLSTRSLARQQLDDAGRRSARPGPPGRAAGSGRAGRWSWTSSTLSTPCPAPAAGGERPGVGAASCEDPVIRVPIRALTAARGSRTSGTRATTRPARATAPMTTVPISDRAERPCGATCRAGPRSRARPASPATPADGRHGGDPRAAARSVSRVRSEPSRRRSATSPEDPPGDVGEAGDQHQPGDDVLRLDHGRARAAAAARGRRPCRAG